jgi:hypothetical protein
MSLPMRRRPIIMPTMTTITRAMDTAQTSAPTVSPSNSRSRGMRPTCGSAGCEARWARICCASKVSLT